MFKQIIHKIVYPAIVTFRVTLDTFRDSKGAVANVILDKFSIWGTILMNLSISQKIQIKKFVILPIINFVQKLIINTKIKQCIVYAIVSMRINLSQMVFIKKIIITAPIIMLRPLFNILVKIKNIKISTELFIGNLIYLSIWDSFTTEGTKMDSMDSNTLEELYTA